MSDTYLDTYRPMRQGHIGVSLFLSARIGVLPPMGKQDLI